MWTLIDSNHITYSDHIIYSGYTSDSDLLSDSDFMSKLTKFILQGILLKRSTSKT